MTQNIYCKNCKYVSYNSNDGACASPQLCEIGFSSKFYKKIIAKSTGVIKSVPTNLELWKKLCEKYKPRNEFKIQHPYCISITPLRHKDGTLEYQGFNKNGDCPLYEEKTNLFYKLRKFIINLYG